MAKKQDTFYFDTFTACAAHAVKASEILRKCITDYDPDNLDPILEEISRLNKRIAALEDALEVKSCRYSITNDNEDIKE